MLCFSSGTARSTTRGTATAEHSPSPSPTPAADPGSAKEEDEGEEINSGRRRIRVRSPLSECSSAPTTSTAATSPASATINLSREYLRAVTTSSYKEIWSKIHRDRGEGERSEEEGEEEEGTDGAPGPSSARLISRVLQPNRASIQEALRGAPSTYLTRLVSDYFSSSEHTSHFCLTLSEAVERARSLYAPIGDLIDLLLAADDGFPVRLTQAQCDWAFDRLLEFNRLANPFPSPFDAGSGSFQGLRGCFVELKQHLDVRHSKAHRRHRLLRRCTRGSATCLIVSTIGLAVTGVILATHALVGLMAGPILIGGCQPTRDLLAGPRRRLQEYMAQLDEASRITYALNNDLCTIECLVKKLHATVENDRVLVHLGLEGGKGQRYPIEEVVRQLGKNHPSFLKLLEELEEHICLYFAAVNRARSLLLRQIQQQPPPP